MANSHQKQPNGYVSARLPASTQDTTGGSVAFTERRPPFDTFREKQLPVGPGLISDCPAALESGKVCIDARGCAPSNRTNCVAWMPS